MSLKLSKTKFKSSLINLTATVITRAARFGKGFESRSPVNYSQRRRSSQATIESIARFRREAKRHNETNYAVLVSDVHQNG